jgi:hypothetical protein
MNIATDNPNSESFATGRQFHSTFGFTQDKPVNRFEISITKGMVKFFLGMVYFAALVYSFFMLLT